MTATTLPPVRRTRMARPMTRSGPGRSLQCWEAQTTDGEWGFERQDDTGTLWAVFHLPSVADGTWTQPVTLCRTLRSCRSYVGSGEARRDLAQHKLGRLRDGLAAMGVTAESPLTLDPEAEYLYRLEQED